MLNLQRSLSDAVQTFWLAASDAGTSQTIAAIRRLVDQGKKNIHINRLAIALAWNTPQFSEGDKAAAIFQWVQQNFRYIRMVWNAQTLRSVDEILRVRAGDCTNLNAILLPSLLETIGIECRLVTIAHDPSEPNEFTHVYCEAKCDGQWIALDVARPGAAFGRAPEEYFRETTWSLDSPDYYEQPRSNLNGYQGIGDASNDFATDVTAATSGATNILLASEASPSNIYGVANPNAGISLASGAAGANSLNLSIGGIPLWIVLLFGVGAVVLISRGGKR